MTNEQIQAAVVNYAIFNEIETDAVEVARQFDGDTDRVTGVILRALWCQDERVSAVAIGQRIEAGTGDDRERGTIGAIDGDRVTIQWDSGVVTTQPIAALDDLTIL